MRNIIVFAAAALAGMIVVTAQGGPAHTAPTNAALTSANASTDTLVGTQSQVPVQLVRDGRRGGVGRSSFRGSGFRGGFRGYGGGRYFYGGAYVPYYRGYYNRCYWDGYEWVCPDYLY